jgi:hypothetical protein
MILNYAICRKKSKRLVVFTGSYRVLPIHAIRNSIGCFPKGRFSQPAFLLLVDSALKKVTKKIYRKQVAMIWSWRK